MNQLDTIASKSLGDSTSYAIYADAVDSTLLNPMPRALARGDHDIIVSQKGYDVWHCYEATYLNQNGVPIAGVLKIIVPHSSDYIVESKSLKLYLNTYDMVKFNSMYEYAQSVESDLSKALKCNVQVTFFTYGAYKTYDIISSYCIEETPTIGLHVDAYSGNYSIPKSNAVIKGLPDIHQIYIPALRSRCRHTKQKDSGAVCITLLTSAAVNKDDIMRYVYSLREVNEFHEFCAEKIYSELKRAYGGSVAVHCFYVRRGGIDISPCRFDDFSEDGDIFAEFGSDEILVRGFSGQ